MRRIILLATLAMTAVAVAAFPAVAGATTTGSWQLNPAQATGTSYQAAVQQPINPNGTSSWPAKRGVIPVQFQLLQASSTGPVIFQSLSASQGTGIAGKEYSNLIFTPTSGLTFDQITNLQANYAFTSGDCHGGSLRWSIGVNTTNGLQFVYVYYGAQANGSTFINCASGDSSNKVGGSANVELGSVTPGVYGSWQTALSQYTGDTVAFVGLVLDGGWGGDQVVNLSGATVNNNSWTPLPVSTGTFAPTCTLPTAAIHVYKTGSADPLPVDETTSVSAADTSGFFREVDCKYIYNLDISSLGTGTFKVYAAPGGTDINNPGQFGLR